MWCALAPRKGLVYGQDFLRLAASGPLAVKNLYPAEDGQYSIPSRATLVVCHDLGGQFEAMTFCSLDRQVAAVAHTHLQWNYMEEKEQRNIVQALRRADRTIVPARFLGEQLLAHCEHLEIEVVYNGVDSSLFFPSSAEERVDFRKRLGLKENAFLAMFVGQLLFAKGTQVIEAIASLLRGRQDLHICVQFPTFVSSIKSRERYRAFAGYLRDICPQQIHLIEDADPLADRPVRYADVLLHPSLSEVNPRVVCEALMAGVPVIATVSTPFFAELAQLGIGPSDVRLVRLPDQFAEGARSRSELKLVTPEAESIAREFMTLMEMSKVPDDINRYRRAESACVAGFSMKTMVAAFKSVYQAAEAAKQI
jgi:glycosyltransferase involved in cell wall biosynthesis